MADIILDRCVKESVGHRATGRDRIQEKIEAVAASAELDLGVRIERIVIDRLDQRPLDHVRGAGHQDEQVRHTADRLIGISDPIIDMDRTGGCDQADEQADTD
ncbi:hypothetical protein M2337_002444 [Sphingobium sp. B2D3A]|nr:hypothetical protein [Sphingobium sp. B2D3A]